jgi:hypothetical protein
MSDDAEFEAYAERVLTELVPKIEDSAVTVSLVPSGPSDVKFAVELGLSIMLDKPIIAVVDPGAEVPAKLVQVADEIVEADFSAPDDSVQRIRDAVFRVTNKRGKQ